MTHRHRIPLAILGALTILTAGFAYLAIATAPSGDATQAVQNATGETFGADTFSLDLTSSVSSGPNSGTISQVRRIDYSAPGAMTVRRVSPTVQTLGTLHGNAVTKVLAGYSAVTAGTTPWVKSGSQFTRTESLKVFSRRVYEKKAPSGKVIERAVVKNGLLIYVNLNVVVPSRSLAGGARAPGGVIGETLHLVTINGSPTPAVATT